MDAKPTRIIENVTARVPYRGTRTGTVSHWANGYVGFTFDVEPYELLGHTITSETVPVENVQIQQVIRFSDNTPRCTTCGRDGHKPRTWDGHWFTNASDDADRERAAAR